MSNNNYSRTQHSVPCKGTCAGGNPCACNGTGHVHHICREPDCQCHAPETYGMIRVGVAYQRISAVTWREREAVRP